MVFPANGPLALGVLQEMTVSRIKVPDSISIVGYDDIGFAAATPAPAADDNRDHDLTAHLTTPKP